MGNIGQEVTSGFAEAIFVINEERARFEVIGRQGDWIVIGRIRHVTLLWDMADMVMLPGCWINTGTPGEFEKLG